jgi:dihydroorotate dehydrogenase
MTRSVALWLATASLPILLCLEPERAHRLAMRGLKMLRPFWPPLEVAANFAVDCAGLRFAHPVGIAAGFDKDGDYLDALGALGFSHVEVGTVTPRPQPGNPPPRIHRIASATALVNRMGFNSKGIQHVVHQLQRSTFGGIRGVSIGKNAETPVANAADDYLTCLRAAYSLADYFAINVSSPNTSDLRRLQGGEDLGRLMGALQDERVRLIGESGRRVPIFVKIAPDLSAEQLATLAREFRRLGVDGVIATNTTVALDDLSAVPVAFEGGGLSGAPLHRRSLAVIAQLRSELGAGFPIIGVGGITTAEAAVATLNAGANVIQLYTGLIYRGPGLLHEILRTLARA